MPFCRVWSSLLPFSLDSYRSMRVLLLAFTTSLRRLVCVLPSGGSCWDVLQHWAFWRSTVAKRLKDEAASPWELATPKRLGDPPPLQSSCRFLPPLVQSQGTQLVRARKLCVCLRDVVSTPTATSRDVKLTPKMNRSARCGTPLLFGPEPEPPLP